MKNTKRWISVLVLMILLVQTLPLQALADTGSILTESELQQAMQLAGLETAEDSSKERLSLTLSDSGYHEGMKPDSAWDVPMLNSWLENMRQRELYNLCLQYNEVLTTLDQMKESEPATYTLLTGSAEGTASLARCQALADSATLAEKQAQAYQNRLTENRLIIAQNIEILANSGDSLFDYEKRRYSAQIRESMEELESLRTEVLAYADPSLVGRFGAPLLGGNYMPEITSWMRDVLDSADSPELRTGYTQTVTDTGNASNTLSLRLSAAGGQRVLNQKASDTFHVQVLDQNEFAISIRGAENKPLAGVKITVKDLNGTSEITKVSEDPNIGSAVFSCSDFVCDWDQEMELALTVDGTELGYRSFYIPWMRMKRGGSRTETLMKLTDPLSPGTMLTEADGTTEHPYAYACTFNGKDILKTEKTIQISELNDYSFDFAIEVKNPSGRSYSPPVLHFWSYNGSMASGSPKEFTMTPSSSQKTENGIRYVYTGKWKKLLSPDISKDQRPYFVFPDTGAQQKTQAIPVRSKIDQPVIGGTESGSPLREVFGEGLNISCNIPILEGGLFGIKLPFQKYLPKVQIDPFGYITVTIGSPLVEKTKGDWKSAELEDYEKQMKKFEHDISKAGIKQRIGSASKLYKKMTNEKSQMMETKLDFGWFLMLAGKWEAGDKDDGTTYWNAGGMGGFSLTFSFDLTQPASIGPVPFYVALNFSASAGFGAGISVRVLMDKDKHIRKYDFDLGGITINVRLAMTATLGFGIKGLASIWIAATGELNVILQFVTRQPLHVAVYAQAFLSCGFEFFFISYSQVIAKTPRGMIYQNYDLNSRETFHLLRSAQADETGPQADEVALEPESYSALTSQAELNVRGRNLSSAGMKVLDFKGKTYAFFLERRFGSADMDQWRFNLTDTERTTLFNDPDIETWESPVFAKSGLELSDYNDYGFDVITDGERLYVVVLTARKFKDDGTPLPGMTDGKPNIVLVYFSADGVDTYGGFDGGQCLIYPWTTASTRFGKHGNSPTCSNPRIETAVRRGDGKHVVYGTVKGQDDNVKESQYSVFCVVPEENQIDVRGDCVVGGNYGNYYRRAELRPNLLAAATDQGIIDVYDIVNMYGFVALDRPREGRSGDSYLVMYDYYMKSDSDLVQFSETADRTLHPYVTVEKKLRPVVLAQGDIESFEMVQNLGKDGKTYTQSIFYVQKETVGERTENRLKGIHISRPGYGADSQNYEITYTDYDLSIPTTDFRAVTLGASQYLYWLTAQSKEKETDPDRYRVTGVYYDAQTGSVSDQIVFMEFSIPGNYTWTWDDQKWNFVPTGAFLTQSGYGYIPTKPKANIDGYTGFVPLNVYRLKLNLKPVANLKGVSVMDSAVCQGAFVSADLAIMNEGNMGIGSFVADVILMENGREKETVETLYANCLCPDDSRLVMRNGYRTVATGEAAIARYKDFGYDPRQHEWIVQEQTKTVHMRGRTLDSVTEGETGNHRITTNVVVPGVLGTFTSSIKIPADWHGQRELRVRISEVSTYTNWLAASVLAKEQPALFAMNHSQTGGTEMLNAAERNTLLAEKGIQRLDYVLDQGSGKMLLSTTPNGFLAASGNDLLYENELQAPEPVSIRVDVHDIDVGHRVYQDYYGNEMLELTIHNYYNNEQPIRLYCLVYEDDATVSRNYNLPHDQDSISAGRTQTITIPLSDVTDVNKHQKIRMVIRGIGIEETAMLNNEFEVYLGGAPEPEPTATPRPVPQTGDTADFTLWGIMIGAGIALLMLLILFDRKRLREKDH
jgi:hypothetical protein